MTLRRTGLNYHRYLPSSPGAEAWGVAVTAAGRQVSSVGAPYPPKGHPGDHAFSWETGRVLGACQVVFITAGRGFFESQATGATVVEKGTALVVLPGVWHRYRPDVATGWVEHWVELRGSVVDRLVESGVLVPERAVVRIQRALEMASFFEGVHARLANENSLICDPERGALGLQIIALINSAQEVGPDRHSILTAIGRAERMMAASLEKPLAIPALARELGIGYSYFRREFKRHTGLSPHRYLAQMRLEKARRMIGSSSESLKEIAERLGFSSQYHFSTAFKRLFGVSPREWRRAARRESRP